MATSGEASSSSLCEDTTANCNTPAESCSNKPSSCAPELTESAASPPGETELTRSATIYGSSVPPLSTYSCSPFSFGYSWLLRISIVYRFIIGGVWGFQATASVFLLPQQLLRLFTLGGCGLLLLLDIVSGLRQTYTRLLQQQQREWVQRMLLLLRHTEQQDTNQVLLNQRQRLQQLVAAVRLCIAAAASSSDSSALKCAPVGSGPAGAAAEVEAAAVTAEAAAAAAGAAPAAAAQPSIPHETEAAAQLAVSGDVQLAAVVFGAPPEAITAACDVAQLLEAEMLRQCKLQQQQQSRTAAAAAAAAVAAAGAFLWGAAKCIIVFVGCVLLMHLFTDIPAAASVAAAAAADPQLSPWWLLLLHALARGSFAAALMNQHVSSYVGLTFCRSLDYNTKCSRRKNSTSSSGTELAPKPFNVHLRFCFAFCAPIICSLVANAASGVAFVSAAAAGERHWGWGGLLLLPLALLQAALQQVLPLDSVVLLPLKRQRSEAALLLLLLQQHQLTWSMLPKTEVLQEYFAAGTLLTAAAAAATCCSKLSALWVAHMRLEGAAEAAAAAQLLGVRSERLQQLPLSERLRSKCRWVAASVQLFFFRIPWRCVGFLRRLFVFALGLSWLLLLLHAFLNTPLLQRSQEAELHTPLQLLQEELQHQEAWEGLQQAWNEILGLQREVRERLRGKSCSEGIEWLLHQLQLSWEEYLRSKSEQADELQRARDLFGLSEGASSTAIKHRYRQLAKLHHPDRAAHNSCSNSNSSGSSDSKVAGCVCVEGAAERGQQQCTSRQEAMQQINLAYELLLQHAGER
ncbi:hypothetical protein, conserved [Eimeria maxima]|uniref:J domain-containing protein n=1 Tax=Eimeria maxima TaxID=5804 RepID=U6M390_EIMMA|nr:hypothetical protein, conserved [Eimeria maxima]CDJ56909.1 hypothetical protein, conserved [Eimeria maxima]